MHWHHGWYQTLVSTLVYCRWMSQTQKITIEVPTDLLEEARAATGEGVTATVREGLKILASRRAQREFMKLRGKVKLRVDLNQLRADR